MVTAVSFKGCQSERTHRRVMLRLISFRVIWIFPNWASRFWSTTLFSWRAIFSFHLCFQVLVNRTLSSIGWHWPIYHQFWPIIHLFIYYKKIIFIDKKNHLLWGIIAKNIQISSNMSILELKNCIFPVWLYKHVWLSYVVKEKCIRPLTTKENTQKWKRTWCYIWI